MRLRILCSLFNEDEYTVGDAEDEDAPMIQVRFCNEFSGGSHLSQEQKLDAIKAMLSSLGYRHPRPFIPPTESMVIVNTGAIIRTREVTETQDPLLPAPFLPDGKSGVQGGRMEGAQGSSTPPRESGTLSSGPSHPHPGQRSPWIPPEW